MYGFAKNSRAQLELGFEPAKLELAQLGLNSDLSRLMRRKLTKKLLLEHSTMRNLKRDKNWMWS